MIDVFGKWALITGASRGIGREIAFFMAKKGCNLILHSRTKEHCNAIIEEISAQCDASISLVGIAAELSDPSSVNAMLDKIERMGINIDIIFNNAGVQVAYRTDYWQTPAEDYVNSFYINTIAPMMICYRLMPAMLERGFGRVINVSSGIMNEPEQAGYSASKAGLDKVTRDLAGKLDGTGVTLNLADPGWCRTDLGGPNAPNAPESVIPGICVGAFVDNDVNGKWFSAQEFNGMTLEQAVEIANKK